jgi:hypothetical protein
MLALRRTRIETHTSRHRRHFAFHFHSRSKCPSRCLHHHAFTSPLNNGLTQLLLQGDAKVFEKYLQMRLPVKREALQKLNRKANEGWPGFDTERPN